MKNSLQVKRILWVGVFAIAMAFLEAAVVVYLRRVYGITDLMLSVPPFDPRIGAIEFGRELSTLVMLLSVGIVAGQNLQSRLGVAIFAFGLWDVFYYIWLRVFIGWPSSLLDPDLLFLIPLPWWGPVLSPVLIALLMVVVGVLLSLSEEIQIILCFTRINLAILLVGMLVVLYTFMADALALLPADAQALSQVKLSRFNWPVYIIGYVIGLFGILRSLRRPATVSYIGFN